MSTCLSIPGNILPAASEENIAKIHLLEEKIREREPIEFTTEHVFHAGMYSRTVRIPAGAIFTSVLIKCPTLLIANGTCDVLTGNEIIRLEGYSVIPASAGRKLVYITRTDVEMTMIFPSNAKTIEQAESEFTDEVESLLSRTNENVTCLE